MLRRLAATVICALALAPGGLTASRVTLAGSRASVTGQNEVARKNEYTFLRTAAQVRRFVDQGLLLELKGNDDYRMAGVAYPYARPEVRTFVERLAFQYRAACGEQLVVTSATRPLSSQPANASELSVHPAGMAVDLRISPRAGCRAWLEAALLSLEQSGLLDVTRERRPPHYHVAVFPEAYARYVSAHLTDSLEALAAGRAPRRHAAVAGARVTQTPAHSAGIPAGGTLPAWLAAIGLTLLGAGALVRARSGRLVERARR